MRIRFVICLFLFVLQGSFHIVKAQVNWLPAGTILRCVLDEPKLSPSAAQVGDPILCRLQSIRIGDTVLSHESYLQGHVEAEKRLGNFGTHGSIKLVFDRIGSPSAVVPATARVIAVENQNVDRDGKIIGNWLSEPVLRPETIVTVKVMQDVELPRQRTLLGPGWHFFGDPISR